MTYEQEGQGDSAPPPPPFLYTHKFKVHGGHLCSHPLHSTEGTRQWKKGDEGWIADSLGKALLIPSNVVALEHHDDRGVMLALKRHFVVV